MQRTMKACYFRPGTYDLNAVNSSIKAGPYLLPNVYFLVDIQMYYMS